jgi:phage portal protein BeeE
MTFSPVHEAAEANQLIDQLKWTVSDVARTFHYPEFKLGGPLPPYAGNISALITSYYVDCLQTLIESMELCLDEGLGLPTDIGTEMDTDSLLRMDTAALYESISKASDWMKLNEQRLRANLQPLPIGGDTVYKQEQDHSIEALAKRDALPDPFGGPKPPTPAPAPTLPPAPTSPGGKEMTLQQARDFPAMLRKKKVA